MTNESIYARDLLQPLMDALTGADGGIKYMELRQFIENTVDKPEAEFVHNALRDLNNLIKVL